MEVEYNELRNLVMYPEPIKTLRQNNISFGKSGAENAHPEHQGGNFMFEQQIKRWKMLVPKGKASEKTRQCLSRNVDVVDTIAKTGMSFLNLDDNDSVRITKIENELVVWPLISDPLVIYIQQKHQSTTSTETYRVIV